MSEVFISYARATEAAARQVEQELRRLGYAVWRDDELPAHRAYTDVIEERLRTSKAVVVVWSTDAVKSQWVQSEADHARTAGKLVQLTIDGATLPMPFDRIQCADLAGWDGDIAAPGWAKVAASVAELVGAQAAPQPAPREAQPERFSSKPSIAVLPFSNLSGDPAQNYFTDGMVEDIVASLSRFKILRVIAAGGVISGGRVLGPREAARELGVDYLLEGSVRRAADRVRINVHLVDGRSGTELWTYRFDEVLDDVFALQDKVAERVAGAVDPVLQETGIQTASRRPTSSLDGYDLYLRSLPPFRMGRKDSTLEAIDLLEASLSLDPQFAWALGQSAICHRQVVDYDWADDVGFFRRRGLGYAERALIAAPDDARVLALVAGGLPGLEGSFDRSLLLADQAIALNPAATIVWVISGSVRLRHGEADVAAEQLETALRLDPISPMGNFARMYLAQCRFEQGRFPEALSLYGTTTMRIPISYAILASLYGHLGRLDAARDARSQFDGLHAGSFEKLTRIWFPREESRSLLVDGVNLAGVAQ